MCIGGTFWINAQVLLLLNVYFQEMNFAHKRIQVRGKNMNMHVLYLNVCVNMLVEL